MTGSVTGIRRRRTVAGRRETSHLPPDRAFYGQTLCSPFYTQRPFASTGIAPRGPLRAALPCLRHLPFELSLFGASPRYYGLIRLLASLSLFRGLPSS